MMNICPFTWRPCSIRSICLGLSVLMFVNLACSVGASAGARRAVWVSAVETNLGVNVVRDDGRVVAYFDISGVKGARLIPGLYDIIATTARLALRRDGKVLTWKPRCGANPSNLADVEHEFCEYPEAYVVESLSNIVAISERDGVYLALDRSGQVWGWGDDSDGIVSGLPSVPRDFSKPFKRRLVRRPQSIPLPTKVVAISAGVAQGGAIDRDGHTWIWGGNRLPDLQAPGVDVVTKKGFAARRVSGIPEARAIDSTYVITRTGDVWRWGISKVNGIRGSVVPSRLNGISGAIGVSCANLFTTLLDSNGTVRFLGIAPDKRSSGLFIDEPLPSHGTLPAIFVSGGARITIDGVVVLYNEVRSGTAQTLEIE